MVVNCYSNIFSMQHQQRLPEIFQVAFNHTKGADSWQKPCVLNRSQTAVLILLNSRRQLAVVAWAMFSKLSPRSWATKAAVWLT